MVFPVNPYIAGNPVGDSPAFVGRADVLRDVLRVLRRPQDNAVVLYGQRRIGKTSILQHLAAWLSRRGPFRPVYYDLQDKAAWPLDRVLQELARTVAHALGQPEPNLRSDPVTAFRQAWLPSVLDGLPEGCSLVLLFDEFDVLAAPSAEQAAAAFFPYLRGLLDSDRRRLQFVFVVGRNVDDLDNIALSLFKGIAARRVSLLSRDDTAHLVRLSESNGTLSWTDEAVERVWGLTCGHPFLTQQLCSHVWEQAYDAEPDGATAVPEDVDGSIAGAVEASRHALEWLWDGLPPAERVVASALAEAGSGPITQDGLEQLLHESGVRVVIRELQNAPELLQDWDLLEPVDGGYLFRVELLRRWIVEHKPLKRVQEELDRIAPIAENLYQAGLGYYRNEQLDLAIDSLRQAVGLNPNHVRANQLLADILLAQGQPGEAQQLLEQLFEYQPAAARPRLVQALLAQSQVTESEYDLSALYERVLALDPVQPEAIAGRRSVWQRRGDAKLADGDLEEALEAYQMVGLVDKMAEVEQEMRRRDLNVQLEVLEALEQDRRYQDALVLAHALADEYRDVRDWLFDLERLQQQVDLADIYQHALGALHSGDRQTAQTLLAQVVALEPGYEDATRYLHLAVTGVDVAGLQAELTDEAQTRRQQPQAQLEAVGEAYQQAGAAAEKGVGSQREQPRRPGIPAEIGGKASRRATTVTRERIVPDALYRQWGTLIEALGAVPRALARAVMHREGDWLVSTFVWLPLFIPALAIGTHTLLCAERAPSYHIYLWISSGPVLAWILTGWLGSTKGKVAIDLAAVIAGGLAFVVACSVLGGLALDLLLGVTQGLLGAVLVVVAFVAAGGASSGVADTMADDMAAAVAAAVATAMTFVMAIVVVFVIAAGVVLREADIVVIGVICAIMGGVISSITAGVTRSTKGALAMALLAWAFLLWFSFLQGSAVLQQHM
jgi:tetratricopeptide (TPR) repeat protein